MDSIEAYKYTKEEISQIFKVDTKYDIIYLQGILQLFPL